MKDIREISTLLNSFPDEWKAEIPIPYFHAKHNYSHKGSVVTEPSEKFNTRQMACYWFYKPVSLMYKTLK